MWEETDFVQLSSGNFYGLLSGAIQKWRHRGRGWGGYPKVVTKSGMGGGVHANSDIITKKVTYKFLFFS